MNEVQIGMTRDDLIRSVGEPADRITVDGTELLFYCTDWTNTAKAVDRSPFAIVNGKVVAMGKPDYHESLKSHPADRQNAETGARSSRSPGQSGAVAAN